MVNIAIGIHQNRLIPSVFGIDAHRAVGQVDRDSILHLAIHIALPILLFTDTRNDFPSEPGQIGI